MANTITYATVLQQQLDKAIVQELKTGWMDANAGQVIYHGGNEVKIPELSVNGLGDYNRKGESGYSLGDVTFDYKTYTMTQDRGRKFQIDAMDVDETNFVLTAANIMGEFQRTQVVPEIDAYRLSALATKAMAVEGDANVEYGYTVTSSNVVNKIKKGIKVLREKGFNGQLVVHCTYDTLLAVEEAAFGKLSAITFSQGGFNTQVPQIDGCPLIATTQSRMVSAITLNDGKTLGQTAGGYVKADSAKNVNFIIVPVDVPIALTKQDVMRIFDPLTNQQANAWAMDYRRYHDLWVLNSKKEGVFANIADAKA